MIWLDLPIPPSVNALYRNVPRRGRVKTREYDSWRRHAGWRVREQGSPSIKGAYQISIAVRRSATLADLGNLEKPISDLLQEMRVIENDRHAHRIGLAWMEDLPEGVDCRVMVAAWKPMRDAMEDSEINSWLQTAQRGERVTYYTGSALCYAPVSVKNGARLLHRAAERGIVALVQRRVGFERYAYEATRI